MGTEGLRRNSSSAMSTPISAGTPQPQRRPSKEQQLYKERCVVVARQSDGFGLTVTGEYPVKVATVKPNGAAQVAGVREGDRILKVNGMPVTGQNFQEVIKMISGGFNLALTLLGPARANSVSSWDDELFPQIQPIGGGSPPKRQQNGNLNESRKAILEQSFDAERMLNAEWRQRRANELVRMLRKERGNLETLRANCIDGNIGDGCGKLERALCRINELEKQLHILFLLNEASANKVNNNSNDNNNSIKGNANGALISDPQQGKRGSIGSALDMADNQSSRTFPPSGNPMRTAAAQPPAGNRSKVEPIRSWVETGGMHYVQADMMQANEEEEEGEEEADQDPDDAETAGPFGNLQDLKTRPAHLAVFTAHLMNSANPSSLLFYLITDAYPGSSVKEMRRFAYELFSTFLIPGAPLQLPMIAQRDIQAIDKVLRSASSPGQPPQQEMEQQLKKLFIPARTRAIGQINEQLAEFRRKKRFGAIVGMDPEQLDSMARADHTTELRIAERFLYKTLAKLAKLAGPNLPLDFENCERKALALIISMATLIKVVMGLRTSHAAWEKLLDKCPTFLTPCSKSGAGSVFKMRSALGVSGKQKVQVKEHQFVLQPVPITVHCYQCRELVWGVNPQAYFCQNCDVIVHKNCTGQLVDHCWPQQQKARGQQQCALQCQNNSQPPVSASTNSLLSGAGSARNIHQLHSRLHQHRDSRSTGYAQSLLGGGTVGSESLYSASVLLLSKPGHPNKQSSPKTSMSLTPPLNRSQHSVSVSAIALAGSSKEGSSSIDRHGNDLIPVDADGLSALPPGTSALARHFNRMGKLESLDSSSSPPSSTAMLPPPVFSSTPFERILPPDVPPSAPPPPPPQNVPAAVEQAKATVTNTTVYQAEQQLGQLKSMDSGIGTEPPAAGHAPTRSQSMKSEAANQLKRGAKGAASLGAADAVEDGYERPISQQLAVPSVSSLKSGSSSAQDLQQSANELGPRLVRAVEAIATTAGTSSSTTGTSSNEEEARRMRERAERMVVADGDSDLEVETEVPSLESLLSWEVLKHLKPKEKKRQEVINEFFHTERTHVRNLKVLYKVFYRPMVLQRVASPELIKLLFGNLDELLAVHSGMHQKMKLSMEMWRRSGTLEGLYGDIGELVDSMFDGDSGEKLMQETALFCQNQQHALDTLRQRYSRSKDDPFSQFLVEAENNPLCRKLQLKDMIPVEMQRLVKYPLLLENIAKYTREGSEELQRLLHGLDCAKKVLSEVNSAKRNADNVKRMEELQRRLDFTGSEKSFFAKFDFRQHKLVYEGSLQWRQARGKTLDLHVVLLENLLVFLTKVGPESGSGTPPKLQLKIHEAGCIPIMRLASVEVEEKAGDKRAFNLLYKCDLRVFELVAQTATERKTWFRLVENQVAVCRASPSTAADAFLDGITLPSSSPSLGQSTAEQSTPPHQQIQRAASGRFEEVAKMEHVHVLTHPSLVHANEIVVQKPTVMENAQPVLSAAERLRRSDKLIMSALAEKHRILSELLSDEDKGNPEELERIAELMTGLSVAELKQRSSKELAMSAIVHGNRLLENINKGMSVKAAEGDNPEAKPKLDESERHLPSVPCYRLTSVAAPLMNHLKALLQVIQEQENEIQGLKQQVRRLKGMDSSAAETLAPDGLSPAGGGNGRPASMVVLKTMPAALSSASSPAPSLK